jgi:hypothetical protein
MRAPLIYQRMNGTRQPIGGRYVVHADRSVGFALDAYDRTAGVVIDPQLVYGTFLGAGGNATDQLTAVDTDADGNVYVAGSSQGSDYPTDGVLRYGGLDDAVVTKLGPDGRRIYSTYIGGSSYDGASGMKVRADGTAYIVGGTSSSDFPVPSGFQREYRGGGGDAFLVELNKAGTAITRGSFLGGSDLDTGIGIELARFADTIPAGRTNVLGDWIFVYGSTKSPNFPTVSPLQDHRVGDRDGYVAVIDRETFELAFATYAGEPGENLPERLIVKRDTGDLYLWLRGAEELGPLLVKLTATSSATAHAVPAKLGGIWGSFLYGRLVGYSIATPAEVAKAKQAAKDAYSHSCDPEEKAAVREVGLVDSMCLPKAGKNRIPGAVAAELAAPASLMVSMPGCFPDAPATTCTERATLLFLDSNLKLAGHLNFGGAAVGREFVPERIVADPSGLLHILGTTSDRSLPVINSVQTSYQGSSEGFLISLDPNTGQMPFVSYLGGTSFDTPTDLTIDRDGNLWVVGQTLSPDFPVTRSGVQPDMRGRTDGFVVKIQQ